MKLKTSISYLIIALVVLGLFGNLSQACENHESPEISSDTSLEKPCVKAKKLDILSEDSEEFFDIPETRRFRSCLNFLDKLIERFPIIEKILQLILQLVYDRLLDIGLTAT